jgi:predicted dehydrogenase
MGINFVGEMTDKPRIKIGYIGCGSHSRRNVLPALKFAADSVETVAICDLNHEKAKVFASEFGFKRAYGNHIEMLEQEDLDAVCIVTGYDGNLRPIYPALARDCIERGCHVFAEKPPAATSGELISLKKLAKEKNKEVLIAFKKMFFPANEKAKQLSDEESFGGISMALLQYPQYVPTQQELTDYFDKSNPLWSVCSFLDHLCHPVSLLVYLMGTPESLNYMRGADGTGIINFSFADGAIASIALTHGSSNNGGMEHTQLFAKNHGKHITIENNIKLSLHQTPPDLHYGASPSFYTGTPENATAVWEPEFSLGQLYNKGLFLLGYYGEVEAFAQAVINKTRVPKAGLDDAIIITKIFESFVQGPNKMIKI